MPEAILRALTPEAEAALDATEVAIHVFPFRVGRESRYHRAEARRGAEERRIGGELPNNELYLFDRGRLKFVSREHFQIEHPEPAQYLVRERGSVCGTLVGNAYLGGDRETGECGLEDGNTITVGGPESPYVFQFVVDEG